jgi:hypothetical protein
VVTPTLSGVFPIGQSAQILTLRETTGNPCPPVVS